VLMLTQPPPMCHNHLKTGWDVKKKRIILICLVPYCGLFMCTYSTEYNAPRKSRSCSLSRKRKGARSATAYPPRPFHCVQLKMPNLCTALPETGIAAYWPSKLSLSTPHFFIRLLQNSLRPWSLAFCSTGGQCTFGLSLCCLATIQRVTQLALLPGL